MNSYDISFILLTLWLNLYTKLFCSLFQRSQPIFIYCGMFGCNIMKYDSDCFRRISSYNVMLCTVLQVITALDCHLGKIVTAN